MRQHIQIYCQTSLLYFSVYLFVHLYETHPDRFYNMKSLGFNSQVIVGTFVIDPIKDTSAGIKGDVSTSKLPPPVEPASNLGFRPAVDSSGGNTFRGNEEHQAIGGNHFMFQQSHPVDWGSPDSRNVGFELSGMNFGGFGNPLKKKIFLW